VTLLTEQFVGMIDRLSLSGSDFEDRSSLSGSDSEDTLLANGIGARSKATGKSPNKQVGTCHDNEEERQMDTLIFIPPPSPLRRKQKQKQKHPWT
jgi:hypothetical protein